MDFGLIYVAGTQTSMPGSTVLLISLAFGSIAFLIALVGLISVRILKVSDGIKRNMAIKASVSEIATRKQIEQLDKNNRLENRRELANVFHQIEATVQLESVYGFSHLLPSSRSWAASPDLIVEILNQIRDIKPKLIVELGSGLSTVWIARMLEQSNFGKLISIDHDPKFAQKTRKLLLEHNLESYVDLRVGALETQAWNDGSQSWYPKTLLEDLEEIDLLLVDGPPKNDSSNYRWPAMWELESRMNASARIILDDLNRKEECDLAKAWADLGGYNLEVKNLEKGAGILFR